jgi:hypothetical protein
VNSESVTETAEVTAKAAAECDEYCCIAPKQTEVERAERRARRKVSYDNSVRLLHFAEKAALEGEPENAKAFTDLATAWDTISY